MYVRPPIHSSVCGYSSSNFQSFSCLGDLGGQSGALDATVRPEWALGSQISGYRLPQSQAAMLGRVGDGYGTRSAPGGLFLSTKGHRSVVYRVGGL